MKRVLTIEVEIDQPEANWIWESHMKPKEPINGCVVKVICEGSYESNLMLDRIEQMEDESI